MRFKNILLGLLFAAAACVDGIHAASPKNAPAPVAEGGAPSPPNQTEFRQALPGYNFSFPRDHAAHPEFQTEWWYFTGHLTEKGKTEEALGYELTFFRVGVQPKPVTTRSAWSLRDIYFAHFALSDLQKKKFWFSEKISRGALGLAGAEAPKLKTWIENWSLQPSANGAWRIDAEEAGRALHLELTPSKPEVIHGKDGVSQKSEGLGKATHYISQTRMKTTGDVRVLDRSFQVVGESWHDHEFGSNSLSEDQAGWDWFSLQFESGEEMMIYLLRKKDGCFEATSSGTWIDVKGKATHIALDQLSVLSTASWKSAKTGAVYPARWEIRVPFKKVSVVIEPFFADQELTTKEPAEMSYWEGACRISGSHRGKGYVELTGYGANKLKP